MSSATVQKPTGQRGHDPRRYSPEHNLLMQGAFIVAALAMRFVFHSDWKATLFLFLCVPALALVMFLRDGRGNIPVGLAVTPTVFALVLGVVMLAFPAGATAGTSRTNLGDTSGTGAVSQRQPGPVPAPAVTTLAPVKDSSQMTLDERLLAWDAKIPLGQSPEAEPSAEQPNAAWVQIVNFWMNDVINPEATTYDGPYKGDFTMADTVVAEIPSQLYPALAGGKPATAWIDPQQAGTWKGGSGDSVRTYTGPVSTNDGVSTEHTLKFSLHKDSSGRTHLLVKLTR